ncbi:hypothetical protein D5b_00300 [Faustovirus]|nr:hypothetical protein D5b_00300 [Faustovirus]AMN84612.1 hypothetical protein D6_00209 [Faustovirus]AMP44248.1 hypothetical protein PRJ_Dakar_00293 [Faustovirus]
MSDNVDKKSTNHTLCRVDSVANNTNMPIFSRIELDAHHRNDKKHNQRAMKYVKELLNPNLNNK